MFETRMETWFGTRAGATSRCLLVLILAACSSKESAAPPPPVVPVAISAMTPTALTGTVRQQASPAPAVRVVGSDGRPFAGVAVTFTVGSGGGTVSGGAVTTDASGVATVGSWTLGPTAGSQTLVAAAGALGSITFTALAAPGAPASVTVASGDGRPVKSLQLLRTPYRSWSGTRTAIRYLN